MVKKIVSVLVSTRLTAFLFLFFSAAMAIGTFVESKHGTDAAKILIYNAKWFELIILIFLVNFIFNIKRYSLLRREKLGILLLQSNTHFDLDTEDKQKEDLDKSEVGL